MLQIDLVAAQPYRLIMSLSRPAAAWPRLLALFLLACVLMLNGLLGAMASGAHAGEARLAAQLGVICTSHGTGYSDRSAPSKPACVEHCVLASASAMPTVPLADVAITGSGPVASSAGQPVTDANDRIKPSFAAPLPRGPPAFI